MQRITLVGHRSDRKAVLERLQRLGLVDIETASSGQTAQDGFMQIDTRQQASDFERDAAAITQALAVLGQIAPEKKGLLGMFNGRREISDEQAAQWASMACTAKEQAHQVLALDKRRGECRAEIQRQTALLAQLEPWAAMHIPFSFAGTKKTAAFIGAFPEAGDQAFFEQKLGERIGEEIPFELSLFHSSAEQSCAMVLCLKEHAPQMDVALRACGFAKPPVHTDRAPSAEMQHLQQQSEQLRQEISDIDATLLEKASLRQQMQEAADYYAARAEKYRVIGELWHTRHTFTVHGYIPSQDVPRLQQGLCDRFDVVLHAEAADPEQAPVKLQNNAFTAPAASLTKMYALPDATDIDPTPIMSLFYYFMFGMMFSDAGYGLIMVIACALALKLTRPEESMRQNMKLFLYCGISTTIWGALFGSFFGDAVPVVAKTFFDKDITIPALLNPMDEPVTLLLLSFGIGMIQILVGLGCKFYNLWRHGDRWGAVFDVGFWMTALIGLSVLAAGIALGPVWMTVGGVLAGASALGLLLTQGRHKKGAMKIIGGLASLYDSTSYLSDLMSYSRLMALGLTTGVLAQVFNMIGGMFGGGIVGAIIMIPIFIIGHAVNFALNVLGTYVHTLRLQYVELFSKFYEGGGKPFAPFAIHSKFTRIKEETKL